MTMWNLISGFTGDALVSCEDINECDLMLAGCDDNASCNNTFGSFECICNDGKCSD